jgi:hypothetical protein
MRTITPKKFTPKLERFCEEIVKGHTQSEAYRIAFQPKGWKAATIHKRASELALTREVRGRIAEIRAVLVKASQVSLGDWLKKAERFYHADVRKLYDEFGNVKDIPTLGDNEAAMIAGFEVTEDYTKVRLNDGSQEAVPVGYTKKIKLVDPLEGHKYLGKVLGYYIEKRPEIPQEPPLASIDWQTFTLEERMQLEHQVTSLIDRIRQKKLPMVVAGNGAAGGNGSANGHAT